MATPGPLGPTIVPTPTDGTTIPSSLPNPPTVQVPRNADRKLSRHDLIMLFSQEVPLMQAKAVADGTAPAWALKSVLKTSAAEVQTVTTEVGSENLFYQLLPLKSDEGVTYKATGTLQQKNSKADGDTLAEALGHHVTFQLVSTKIDPKTKKVVVSEEVPILNWQSTNFKFDLDFHVSNTFGTPGAIIVKSSHVNEFLLVSFSVQTPDKKVFNFPANSWVYNTDFKGGRIFFSNDVYLPKDTPQGLVALREQELQNLRGSGDGERKDQDRIYDYDVYNDLGNPDTNDADKRPVLGGSKELPYPRRCRTGRPPTKKDPNSESRGTGKPDEFYYIPRDERRNEFRFTVNVAQALGITLKCLLPSFLEDTIKSKDFKSLDNIKALYGPKMSSSNLNSQNTSPTSPVAQATHKDPPCGIPNSPHPSGPNTNWLSFPLPQIIAADDKAWSQDIEFGRQMVSGLNPLIIKLVKEFPIKSTLNPAEFGDPISAITADNITTGLEGLTVDQALKAKRLFVQDYHDIFLPYVDKINALGTAAIYAPRTLVFLKSDNTLTPLAIELVRQNKSTGGKKRSRVFTPPPKDSKKNWVWELAKAHVASVDSIYHQIISHFLRTHAAIEPFTIATNRHLSVLHPINQVLIPHYKNTMDINAAARKVLINSGGIIENNFALGKLTMEMSAMVYKLDWRFDEQALPNDLIKRGMAVPDPSAPHGLKLVFEDYPYAADGLELWGALKDYMTDHVKLFYKSDKDVQEDTELQHWWTEVRTKGHGDKKDSPGWPTVDTIDSLVFTLTTIAWVASCLHAAVNFGQYSYGGYMPNHPSMTRKFIPEPGTPDWELLENNQEKAERFYLDSISNVDQATKVMSTIELLSSHAPDEEYLGQRLTPNWSNDPKVLATFEKFSQKTKEIEVLIHERNNNKSLKNRLGPAKVKYELLLPTSELGMTGKGVPNSVSI